MKTYKLKIVLACISLSLLLFCSCLSVLIKQGTVRQLHEDMIFTSIAMYAKRSVRQIEEGVKNGKKLENFYNVTHILSGAMQASSYMKGVYIVSDTLELIYSAGADTGGLNLTVRMDMDYGQGQIYGVTMDSSNFYIAMPIKGKTEAPEGYMLMCIERSAIDNAIYDTIRTYIRQTALITVYAFAILIIILKRMATDNKKKFIRKAGILLCVIALLMPAADGALTFVRFESAANDAAIRSANAMAFSIQSDINQVVSKGAPPGIMNETSAWLMQNADAVSIIDALYIDTSQKVRAKISSSYMNHTYFVLGSKFAVLSVFSFGLAWVARPAAEIICLKRWRR